MASVWLVCRAGQMDYERLTYETHIARINRGSVVSRPYMPSQNVLGL